MFDFENLIFRFTSEQIERRKRMVLLIFLVFAALC